MRSGAVVGEKRKGEIDVQVVLKIKYERPKTCVNQISVW
jgi:hypothetical protein